MTDRQAGDGLMVLSIVQQPGDSYRSGVFNTVENAHWLHLSAE